MSPTSDNLNLPLTYMTLAEFLAIIFRPLYFLATREACRSHFIGHLHLYYYHWVDTSAGGLIVPESIIRPVVSVSALT
jgi:hypothetical protein